MTNDAKSRLLWTDLPRDLTAEVERILGGPVASAVSQAEGFSPGSADRVATATGHRAFVKAVHRSQNSGSYDLHRREIDVMRMLPKGINAPALLGSFLTGEWAALILEDIAGQHPGKSLDNSDVIAVLDAFATFPRLSDAALETLPLAADEFAADRESWDILERDGVPLPAWAEEFKQRLRAASQRVCEAVEGDYLQHFDGRADNVLIDDGGTAWIIDWPWASVGARWIDGLLYLLDARLRGERIDADELLRTHPLFQGVDAADFDSVLAAVTGQFFNKARLPSPPSMPTLRDFQRLEALAGMNWLRERWS
jgi:aminoglycoside phosphotransferase (APT) family kinase protein